MKAELLTTIAMQQGMKGVNMPAVSPKFNRFPKICFQTSALNVIHQRGGGSAPPPA